MKKLLIIVFGLCWLQSVATHNRAGEITYTHKGGYTYEITITTYTYTPSEANAQRNALPVIMGDGKTKEFPRVKIDKLPDDYQKNTYKLTYTYPGPGSYNVIMEDPNRNLGIVNIFDSVNIPFSISTRINIDPILGNNSTPNLLNPPIDKAAIGQIFIHNPSAFDPDGDSLSYKLTICTGQNGLPIDDYLFPDTPENFYINEVTGDLLWDAPKKEGNYNVAIIIEEWRKGVKIGQITRDIQIDVFETENNPPKIEEIPDICVYAGDIVKIKVRANDRDGDLIQFSATGGPFLLSKPAQFENISGHPILENTFTWETNCSHIKKQPYQVVIKATDSGKTVPLVDMEYFNITVIGHPPIIDNIHTTTNTTKLFWKNDKCTNAKTVHIYRSSSPNAITQDECSRGMPTNTTYKKIATVSNDSILYKDDNGGDFLSQGYNYCYRLVSEYPDGSLSYASEEQCAQIKQGLPFFTKVSVTETSETHGKIKIEWHSPTAPDTSLTNKTYTLKRNTASNKETTVIKENIALNDTSYTDTALNTAEEHYFYSLTVYDQNDTGKIEIGTAPKASSVYSIPKSKDRAVEIQATYSTPWENQYAEIYRQNGNSWEFLISTTLPYLDTGLVNGQEYCYYITTKGTYPHTIYTDSLTNNSQKQCALPQDTVPPKPPTVLFEQNCNNTSYTITWKNEETADTIKYYNIYYKDCLNTDYKILKSHISSKQSFIHSFIDSTKTMSACYYVTAVDDNNNESAPSNDTCMNGCPQYSLPNTFTPNNDEQNEVFSPFPYKFVERVDFKVYNSWGQYIWETQDPNINWQGITDKNLPVTNGVYYYTCDVYEYWLTCKYEPRTLLGFIHIIGAEGVTNPSGKK